MQSHSDSVSVVWERGWRGSFGTTGCRAPQAFTGATGVTLFSGNRPRLGPSLESWRELSLARIARIKQDLTTREEEPWDKVYLLTPRINRRDSFALFPTSQQKVGSVGKAV